MPGAALVGRFEKVSNLSGDVPRSRHRQQMHRRSIQHRVNAKATSSEPAKLATEPSQVFLGLKCGANGCFPAARPTKYAPSRRPT